MKRTLNILVVLAGLVCAVSCKNTTQKHPVLTSVDISKVINSMTDIMIHDVTNPPLASRFFSYVLLSGYEIVSQNDSSFSNMHGRLNGYPEISKPDSIQGYDTSLSALFAMIETAKKMQPSGKRLTSLQDNLIDSCQKLGFNEETIEASLNYGQKISSEILAYAKKDKYGRISNYTRYTPLGKEGDWQPTPPGYFGAVEPFFNTVRPFTLDTCIQFKPIPPIAYSKDKNSPFYKLVQEVYTDAGSGLTEEHRKIAAFWDCNPFALRDNGHMLIGLKKISPGAHWLGITGIACKKSKLDFSKAMKVHTAVAIGLMDGFISCWDEKFRSNRIRPESAIHLLIDQTWEPLLQTPPFPEYLSGHSTISASSATILTHYFGENYQYQDNVEQRFGLPVRSFTSFKEAAKEAAISRLYGGIHFRDAIDNGIIQGSLVGNWVLQNLESKKLLKSE